jgi:hypothetical protein
MARRMKVGLHPVWKKKNALREGGRKCFRTVVFSQDVVVPAQKVCIVCREFRPRLRGVCPGDSFPNEQEESPGDRLVVEVRFAVGRGESRQAGRKAAQCFKRSKFLQVQESHFHVLCVMEGSVWQRTCFERFHPLSVVQGRPRLFCFVDAPCTRSRPRRREQVLPRYIGHVRDAQALRAQK